MRKALEAGPYPVRIAVKDPAQPRKDPEQIVSLLPALDAAADYAMTRRVLSKITTCLRRWVELSATLQANPEVIATQAPEKRSKLWSPSD